MDPKEIVVWGGAAAVGYHPIVLKLLGPTADYLGQLLRSCTEAGAENLGRVLRHAVTKLGSRIETQGSVPPKVVKGLLMEGPFCEDELSAEYFGGVLASARSAIPRDDRGAALLSLLGRLSSYQIRSHYILYSVFKALHDGLKADVGEQHVRQRTGAFVPVEDYAEAMGLEAGEDVGEIMSHSVIGLVRENLVDGMWYACSESREGLLPAFPDALEGGIAVHPSSYGVELFLWAHGRADLRAECFLDPRVTFEFETAIPVPSGSLKHVL